MKWLETWACWPISISLSKTENSHLWNGFPHDPLTLRGFCHCLLWRSGHCLTFSAVWMFSVETEPLLSSALGQLLPSPTIFHTCGWLSICHMCSQFLQELETDFYPASAREQTNSFVWRSMVSTPALLPRDLETQSQSKPAHSTLWLPSQFPPPSINRLSVCENCHELVFGLFTINVPTWMIYDTLAWFPCFVVTLWTASSLPNSSLHAAFLMTYYNETIHAFIYLPWRVTPAFPYPFHKRESFLNPHGPSQMLALLQCLAYQTVDVSGPNCLCFVSTACPMWATQTVQEAWSLT